MTQYRISGRGFAMGAEQEQFDGYYDNTDIFNKLAAITGVQ